MCNQTNEYYNCFNFYLTDDNVIIINIVMSTLYVLVCIQCNLILIVGSVNFKLLNSFQNFFFQIIVYCREREERKFYFPCNQWLAKDEGDGLIVRQLTATTDSSASFQGDYMHFTY